MAETGAEVKGEGEIAPDRASAASAGGDDGGVGVGVRTTCATVTLASTMSAPSARPGPNASPVATPMVVATTGLSSDRNVALRAPMAAMPRNQIV